MVQDIRLPGGLKQQVIAQYVDDTSLTLRREEGLVRRAIYTLDTLCVGSGLIVNWVKSCGYWKAGNGSPRPWWTDALSITWADNNEVSKLLGTTFGLSINSKDADSFLLEMINKALGYWCSTKINSTGRGTVVNGVFLSSTYFFTPIWGGTQKGVTKVQREIANYLWSGSMRRLRSKVSWIQCYQTKGKEGINLINPKDAMITLMCKWLLKAVEPGTSNLHILLRHKVEHFQLYSGGKWSPSLEYFTLPKFQAKKGSKAWNIVGTSWRALVKDVSRVRPSSFEEVMGESMWWSEFAPLVGPGFSKAHATQLHKAGLKRVANAWHDGTFLSTTMTQERFGLKPTEFGAWEAMVSLLARTWAGLLAGVNPIAK
jgi:hypothetical protein